MITICLFAILSVLCALTGMVGFIGYHLWQRIKPVKSSPAKPAKPAPAPLPSAAVGAFSGRVQFERAYKNHLARKAQAAKAKES